MDCPVTVTPYPGRTVLIKTLLNKTERFKSFVYVSVCFMLIADMEALVVAIEPQRNSRPLCPECGKCCTVYDLQYG